MRKYQITDPKYFGSNPEKICCMAVRTLLRYKADYIVFRDKSMSLKLKRRVAKRLQKISQRTRTKILISQEYKLAKEFGFGVHLTSKQLGKISECKRAGMFVVVSTHAYKELEYAYKKRADLMTFSPIFATPNKGEPKGVESLNLINDKIKSKVIALGGITSRAHINTLRGSKIHGFASIRYFVK